MIRPLPAEEAGGTALRGQAQGARLGRLSERIAAFFLLAAVVFASVMLATFGSRLGADRYASLFKDFRAEYYASPGRLAPGFSFPEAGDATLFGSYEVVVHGTRFSLMNLRGDLLCTTEHGMTDARVAVCRSCFVLYEPGQPTYRLYDSAGQLLRQDEHTAPIRSVSGSDDSVLALVDDGGVSVLMTDRRNPGEAPRVLARYNAAAVGFALSSDGGRRMLIETTDDGFALRVYDRGRVGETLALSLDTAPLFFGFAGNLPYTVGETGVTLLADDATVMVLPAERTSAVAASEDRIAVLDREGFRLRIFEADGTLRHEKTFDFRALVLDCNASAVVYLENRTVIFMNDGEETTVQIDGGTPRALISYGARTVLLLYGDHSIAVTTP